MSYRNTSASEEEAIDHMVELLDRLPEDPTEEGYDVDEFPLVARELFRVFRVFEHLSIHPTLLPFHRLLSAGLELPVISEFCDLCPDLRSALGMRNNCQCTALHDACLYSPDDVVVFLAVKRADLLARKSDHGFLPVQLAMLNPQISETTLLTLVELFPGTMNSPATWQFALLEPKSDFEIYYRIPPQFFASMFLASGLDRLKIDTASREVVHLREPLLGVPGSLVLCTLLSTSRVTYLKLKIWGWKSKEAFLCLLTELKTNQSVRNIDGLTISSLADAQSREEVFDAFQAFLQTNTSVQKMTLDFTDVRSDSDVEAWFKVVCNGLENNRSLQKFDVTQSTPGVSPRACLRLHRVWRKTATLAWVQMLQNHNETLSSLPPWMNKATQVAFYTELNRHGCRRIARSANLSDMTELLLRLERASTGTSKRLKRLARSCGLSNSAFSLSIHFGILREWPENWCNVQNANQIGAIKRRKRKAPSS
ncbi:expressed unknown protein [Seminavis robusta]|uniref:Uncharacterized protein n=1 Tax=Seminavis robusta TaxID=568900 RepID=A0A9N8EQ99_9STRA|nr:expressed unknown protein [Seminavis robusta]|eukprot:Sro1660_g289310.1 n/a (481) ;mRNA; f:13076-14518